MTILCQSPGFTKSKATLQAALNENAGAVKFEDPSIFPGSRGYFNGGSIQPGEKFPIVMDPPTRRRFAIVKRLTDGQFRVE